MNLPNGIDPERLPKHIAVVMDGNGRWATRKGLSRVEGHMRGHQTLRHIIESAPDLGIEIITAYAFSTENWKRPSEEVHALMHLFAEAAKMEIPGMMENGVRMMVSGRLSTLPQATQESLQHAVDQTKNNTRVTLNLAINYGGRAEILDATKAIAQQVAHGKLNPEDITENTINDNLYTHSLPDPDLLIRTAGEMRISNFLLWQIAYSEIHVTQVLWPDFTRDDLITAIKDYQNRVRRFGAVVQE